MALSDEHLAKHVVEIQERFLSAGDYDGGGHSGVSLNIYCGILGESPKRLASFMANLTIGNIPKPLQTKIWPIFDGGDKLYFRPYT